MIAAMALQVGNLTFDCDDPRVVGAFWAEAMGLTLGEGGNEFFVSAAGTDGGPNWLFLKVPEAKSAKNRFHLDLTADDPAAEVERLVGLGATRVADKDEWGHRWTVMHDPEGNEFCVSAPHTG